MPSLSLDSPIGRLTLHEQDGFITRLAWGGRAAGDPTQLLVGGKRQLADYFAGRRQRFDLPVRPAGTPLDLKIWQAMADIPYGATRTYGDLANRIGISARIVGQACGRNPIPILLPCHRVVSARGLGGFSAPGGIAWKEKLLLLERALLL